MEEDDTAARGGRPRLNQLFEGARVQRASSDDIGSACASLTRFVILNDELASSISSSSPLLAAVHSWSRRPPRSVQTPSG